MPSRCFPDILLHDSSNLDDSSSLIDLEPVDLAFSHHVPLETMPPKNRRRAATQAQRRERMHEWLNSGDANLEQGLINSLNGEELQENEDFEEQLAIAMSNSLRELTEAHAGVIILLHLQSVMGTIMAQSRLRVDGVEGSCHNLKHVRIKSLNRNHACKLIKCRFKWLALDSESWPDPKWSPTYPKKLRSKAKKAAHHFVWTLRRTRHGRGRVPCGAQGSQIKKRSHIIRIFTCCLPSTKRT